MKPAKSANSPTIRSICIIRWLQYLTQRGSGLLVPLLLTAFMFQTALAQFTTLRIPSGSALPGITIKISVSLGPNASSATAAGFTLSFDPNVATVDSAAEITRGDLISGTDHALLVNLASGQIKLLITSDTLQIFRNSRGTLIEIQFRVPAGAVPGTSTELRVSDAMIIASSGTAMSLITENGSIQDVTDSAVWRFPHLF